MALACYSCCLKFRFSWCDYRVNIYACKKYIVSPDFFLNPRFLNRVPLLSYLVSSCSIWVKRKKSNKTSTLRKRQSKSWCELISNCRCELISNCNILFTGGRKKGSQNYLSELSVKVKQELVKLYQHSDRGSWSHFVVK